MAGICAQPPFTLPLSGMKQTSENCRATVVKLPRRLIIRFNVGSNFACAKAAASADAKGQGSNIQVAAEFEILVRPDRSVGGQLSTASRQSTDEPPEEGTAPSPAFQRRHQVK